MKGRPAPPADGEKLVMALPKGRILNEVMPLLRRVGIEPEPAFADPNARQLRFTTNRPGARDHPRAHLRRRDLRRVRRGPARASPATTC